MTTMRRTILIAVGVVAIGAGLGFWFAANQDGVRPASTAPEDFSARFAGFKAAPEPNGDLRKVVWPNYVLNAGGDVKRLYEFQVTHGELMRYMPCFCGCGQNAGHRSNRDCYITRVNPDGSVDFNPMAPT